jgi:hypothetical protein
LQHTAGSVFINGSTGINLTGPVTVTTGVSGVTNNSNAAAGMVGEFLSTSVTTGVNLPNNTPTNVATLTLTAGDWDVNGETWIDVAAASAGATPEAAINTVSATLPTSPGTGTSRSHSPISMAASTSIFVPLRTTRVSSSTASFPVYLVGQLNVTSGTASARGVITARRRR